MIASVFVDHHTSMRLLKCTSKLRRLLRLWLYRYRPKPPILIVFFAAPDIQPRSAAVPRAAIGPNML